MRASKLKLLLVFSLCLYPSLSFSDMVYLKNENSLEGVIEKESDNEITLNTGYGRITLNKKDIEYIYRYGAKEQDTLRKSWNYTYFRRPEFIPQGLKDIAKDFDNLEGLRDSAREDKKTCDSAKEEIEEIKRNLKNLNANLAGVSGKLSQIKPEDNVNEYNSLVAEFNSLMAKIKLAEYNKNALQGKIAGLEQKISDYINEFRSFKKRFNEAYRVLGKLGKVKEENEYFFEAINKKLGEMNDDFTRHTINYQRYGSSVLVNCLLNGSIKASLILDTGSTLVVLSKNIANKLGLGTGRKSSILLTVADGRKVEANPVILESINVGDAELKNVQAAVLENREVSEEDGLLGMSFLENFLVGIDVKKNRLILEEFNP